MCWEKFLKIRCAWTSFFIKNCIQQTSHFKNYGVVPPSGRYKEASVNLLEVQKADRNSRCSLLLYVGFSVT